MTVETATYINQLDATKPGATDLKSEGDDHLRLIKSTLQATFPNVTGAVTPTHTELNFVDGVTSAIQTQLDAKAALASPALTGTPTAPTAAAGTNTTQLATTAHVFAERSNTATLTNKTFDLANNTFAATSAQLAASITDETGTGALLFANSPAMTGTPTAPTAAPGTNSTQVATTAFVASGFAPLASPAFTGTPTAPTASTGTSSTQVATTAFVAATAFSSALPAQTGNSGKFITTDGTTASWQTIRDVQEFSASGTWTKPAGVTMVMVELWGAGGGGGSGSIIGSGYAMPGANGGCGGNYVQRLFKASDITSTVAVTVGTGGTGGAAATATSGAFPGVSGSSGTAGGDTTFGALATAFGGGAGGAPSYFNSPSTFAGVNYTQVGFAETGAGSGSARATVGGSGYAIITVAAGIAALAGPGGGSGGGVATDTGSHVLYAATAGGTVAETNGSTFGGGGAGGGTTVAGTAGTTPIMTGRPQGSGGGGGAGAVGTGVTAKNGGAGGRCAGGGGGGSVGYSGGTCTSGAGGNGGNGYARITSW